jgi:hypothetical protein
MNRRIRNRTYGGVEAGSERSDLAIRLIDEICQRLLKDLEDEGLSEFKGNAPTPKTTPDNTPT